MAVKQQTESNFWKYFKEYCNGTSIHGFKYFGEERSVFERIWWGIVFALCLSCCITIIFKTYQKYDQSPIIVTFATKETSIHKIPFPAITICPEAKTDRQICNFSDIYSNKLSLTSTTSEEDKYFDYISLICDDLDDPNVIYSKNTTFSDDFFKSLDKIKPTYPFVECQFMGKKFNCGELFSPLIIDEGVCYSFNILDRSEIFTDIVVHYERYHRTKTENSWNIAEGYRNEDNNIYPYRAVLTGATNGLSIVLFTENRDIDYYCKDIQGYRVLLHSPGRMPRLRQEFFRVPLDQSVSIVVQPVMITTSDAVRNYPPEKRDCCFPTERQLRFFRSYSQLNCQLECFTNFTLKYCGCVDFYMPRDDQMEICGTGNTSCLKQAEVASKFENRCDCAPLCADLSFNAVTSQTIWDWSKKYEKDFGTELLQQIHMSKLVVYFKFDHFITSERSELYGPLDFLANFGGLLGLFTGFSILSLMEIIYYVTVRICCNLRLYRNWSGIRNDLQ